jgi:hypothetical protein
MLQGHEEETNPANKMCHNEEKNVQPTLNWMIFSRIIYFSYEIHI